MNFESFATSFSPRTLVIAEAGINHDGSLEKAKLMVEHAKLAGADYVKFQTFKAKKLVTPDALTSTYIDKGSYEGETFESLLARLELDEDSHYALKKHCDKNGIKFLSTAFDYDSFDFLVSLGIDVVKVASGDLTNLPLIRYMANSGLPMIMSTGMATLGEIEEAVETVLDTGNKKIILLHCISWYPADISTTNLNFMQTLTKAFPFPVGYSDHTLGINMTIAATAMGARVIEKHFTLDKNAFGPDHAASIEPEELKSLVSGVREVEEGLGSFDRKFSDKEIGQRKVHRKSIVLKCPVKAGQQLNETNLIIKRPGIGIEPKFLDSIVGLHSNKDLNQDELLSWRDIDFG